MPQLPDPLRAELAETVERTLAPDIELEALAREMDDATGAIRTQSWIRPGGASIDQVSEIKRALFGSITGYEPDLTLLTADEGSPVYMRRWWLRRTLADDQHGQDGLYVHLFENNDPEGFHNHPWPSASLLLYGGPIFEDTRHGTAVIENRSIVLRPASHRHRIRLRPGPVLNDGSIKRIPAMTPFRTGKRVQRWGFEQADGSIKPVASKSGQVPRR